MASARFPRIARGSPDHTDLKTQRLRDADTAVVTGPRCRKFLVGVACRDVAVPDCGVVICQSPGVVPAHITSNICLNGEAPAAPP